MSRHEGVLAVEFGGWFGKIKMIFSVQPFLEGDSSKTALVEPTEARPYMLPALSKARSEKGFHPSACVP